jgi:hypothetical protein
MDTWVLVLVSLVNSQPAGLSSIPGYSSFEECSKAGGDFVKKEKAGSVLAAKRNADFQCIPGPPVPK